MTLVNIGNIQVGNVHTNENMAEAAVEWVYPDLAYPLLVPMMSSSKQSDRYEVHFADEWNRDIDTERGPGGEFNQVEFTKSKDTFYCNGHGLEHGLPWEVLANADNEFQEDLDGAEIAKRLKRFIDVQKEIRTAAFLTTSGNYLAAHYENMDTVANRNFDDSSGPGPLKLLWEKVDLIAPKTGGSKLVMAVSKDAWRYLLDDANLQPSLTASLTTQKAQLAEAVGVDSIVILQSQKNTADHGQAAVRANVWGSNKIILATVGTSGDRMPSTLREYRWKSSEMNTGSGAGVDVIWDARYKNRYVQYYEYFDIKATGVNTAGTIESAVLMDNVYNAIT